jgi:NAD(P)-dependent dehydrogenase (short-subunit alcohol dehydrogenase family)
MTKTALVTGVGPGLGAALVRRFANEGYRVAMFARSAQFMEELATEIESRGEHALAVPTDITDPHQVTKGFEIIRARLGPVDLLINHAGNATWADLGDLTPEDFERSWRVSTYGAFLCCKEAANDMRTTGGGSMLFTGATSGMRGRAGAAAFSSAKFGTRGLAWSLARELWPLKIHVAHVIIDGIIDTPDVRNSGMVADGEPMLDVDAVAQSYSDLVRQEQSAWSFEIDLRPHVEAFFE